jgi:hypothetical protein
MNKRTYTAHHVLQAFIGHHRNKDQVGYIEQIGNPYLYQAMLAYRKDVEQALDLLGLELVVHEAAGVAHARALRPEQLDARAEALGSYGIQTAVSVKRLNYYDTLAFLHFWRMMDATAPGTEPEWVNLTTLVEEMSAHYGKSLEEHGATLVELVSNSLKKLEAMDVIAGKTQAGTQKWRPKRAITLAVSHTSVLQFEQDILELLKNPNATPTKGRRKHAPGDSSNDEDNEDLGDPMHQQQSFDALSDTVFALDIPFDDAENGDSTIAPQKD